MTKVKTSARTESFRRWRINNNIKTLVLRDKTKKALGKYRDKNGFKNYSDAIEHLLSIAKNG